MANRAGSWKEIWAGVGGRGFQRLQASVLESVLFSGVFFLSKPSLSSMFSFCPFPWGFQRLQASVLESVLFSGVFFLSKPSLSSVFSFCPFPWFSALVAGCP